VVTKADFSKGEVGDPVCVHWRRYEKTKCFGVRIWIQQVSVVRFTWLLHHFPKQCFVHYREYFEIWRWRRMEKITWTDLVENEVLRRVKEERNIILAIK
jgi:hypothetical protein